MRIFRRSERPKARVVRFRVSATDMQSSVFTLVPGCHAKVKVPLFVYDDLGTRHQVGTHEVIVATLGFET